MKTNFVITITIKKPWEAGRGHQTHRSGAGLHADRRTKRQGTRASRQRAALAE